MTDSQILFFIALVLPFLFALNFIAEGVHKMMEKEPPILSFSIGFGMLMAIMAAYLLIFIK